MPVTDPTFWSRQHSIIPDDDHPHSLLSPRPPPTPLNLLISTPSGKPLFHYSHPHPTPLQATLTLAAAVSVFQQTTSVRCIDFGVRILFYPHGSYHVVIVGGGHQIVERCLVAVKSLLSCWAEKHLAEGRHINLTEVQESILCNAIEQILTYPFPYLTRCIPVLPTNQDRTRLFSNVTIPSNTHLVITTASPPHPRRLIYSLTALSYDDLTLILSLPPPRADSTPPSLPKIYLPSTAYKTSFHVTIHSMELRLHPDHYDYFHRRVGENWQPEWNMGGGHIIWLIFLSRDPSPRIVDTVIEQLDRSRGTTDVILSMELAPTVESVLGKYATYVSCILFIESGSIVCTQGGWGGNEDLIRKCLGGERVMGDTVVLRWRGGIVVFASGVATMMVTRVIREIAKCKSVGGGIGRYCRGRRVDTLLSGVLTPFDT